MFFATSILHVHLMQWDDVNLVERAVNNCHVVWDSIQPDKVSPNVFYYKLVSVFLMPCKTYIGAISVRIESCLTIIASLFMYFDILESIYSFFWFTVVMLTSFLAYSGLQVLFY